MGDVIIAVAPAPGHEHLIAYGKHHPWCDSERPMLLTCCVCGAWDCAQQRGNDHYRGIFQPKALVLHAPGDPRPGMVRLRAALGVTDWGMVWSAEKHGVRMRSNLGDHDFPPPRPTTSIKPLACWCLGSLAKARGIVAEVLVLPPKTST